MNKKNYKFIIIFLSGLLLFFLFSGNYNLVIEGMDLNDKAAELNKVMSITNKENEQYKAVAEHYKKANDTRKNMLEKDLGSMVEPFTEGMNNCSSNYSNLGVKGNMANIMVNSQCESLQTLKNKNKSVIDGAHINKLNYY